MKIVFTLWALSRGKGGAERLGCDIVNGLARRGHDLTIFTQGEVGSKLCYPLNSCVRVEYFPIRSPNRSDAWFDARRRLNRLAPHVCVVLGSSAALLRGPLLTRGSHIPLILSEHSNPRIIENERWNRADRQAVFSGADRIHLLLESYRDSVHPCLRERVRIIPNATAMPPLARPRSLPEGGNAPSCKGRILAVGRLRDDIKQHSLLVEAMALLRPLFPCWEAHIWGEGPDREMLEADIRSRGLEQAVHLCGTTDAIEREYAGADIFCIPSRYEGFPLALLEAMRHSLPVVGFADSPGVRDVFVPGTGLLAQRMDAQSLSAALARLMGDAELRAIAGENALKATEAFTLNSVVDQWEQLLHETACLGSVSLRYPLHESASVNVRRRLWGNAERQRGDFAESLEEKEGQTADGVFQALRCVWEAMRSGTLDALQQAILERSGLFDRQWYREQYVRGPELMDPLEHYVRFGAKKGYWPNPHFDTLSYRREGMHGMPPGLNPLLHFFLGNPSRGDMRGKN